MNDHPLSGSELASITRLDDIRIANREADICASLLANLEGIAYRCRPDASRTMEYVSEGCLGLTGYPAACLLKSGGISFQEIILPEDRELVVAGIAAALSEQRRYELEYRIVRADGQVRWIWEHGNLRLGESGAIVALEGFMQDITRRVQLEAELRRAERRFRSIFENATEGIFQLTRDQGYLAVNPALAQMYGYASPQQLMDNLHDFERQLYVDPRRRDEFFDIIEVNGSLTNFESKVYRRDGEVIWISESAHAVRDGDGELLFYEGMVEDVTERKHYEARIKFQATHDTLTGLPNRALVRERIQQAIADAQQHGGLAAVVFVDLDQFKYINDSLGHEVGDRLLKEVAQRLRSSLRKGDTVARQGGDEFVLVLTDLLSEEAVAQAMERVLFLVSRPWFIDEMELQITCSMGVSIYPDDGDNVDALLRHADGAMYKAKQSGRNNFQFFAADISEVATARLEMLHQLRKALANNELDLHYQPKVRARDRKVVGVEALLRWDGVAGHGVPTQRVITVAEETGLILPIGEWVLRTACRQNVAWQQAGFPALPVSVNLSPLQLERGDVVEVVARVLQESGMQADCLELEISESVVMRDVAKSLRVLTGLKSLGVRLSIDDFGTGYSSLNYLKQFPLDTLKIDKSFISEFAIEDGEAIVRAIISLGHSLDLNVLAEGVETAEQYDFLLNCGCDEMQGYYFGRPLPAEKFRP